MYSRFPSTVSIWVLLISTHGDFTISVGNLYQYVTTLTAKNQTETNPSFLLFRWNFACFRLCPLPLMLLLCTTEKTLFHIPFLQVFIYIGKFP